MIAHRLRQPRPSTCPARSRSSRPPRACTPMSSSTATSRSSPATRCIVHGAPTDVAFGEHIVVRRTPRSIRAGAVERLWTQLAGYLELTELYEVSFSEGRTS